MKNPPEDNLHISPFKCPYCQGETVIVTPMAFVVMKRTSCQNCGREFLIENDKPAPLPA
jgi:transposase-like protein